MQKAFSMEPYEERHHQMLQQEYERLASRYGLLTLEMDEIKRALATTQDKQRTLLTTLVMRNGVQQFANARIEGNNLVCEVPDEPMQPGKVVPLEEGKVNGVALPK